MEHQIRDYYTDDEPGWLTCRLQAFLDTAYFDDVRRQKESYSSASIELVAVCNDTVMGLLDIERMTTDTQVFGMIWHVATHPSYRRRGIAKDLLHEAAARAREMGMLRLEAWTRDDDFVNDWYQQMGFKKICAYYHIFPTAEEIKRTGIITSTVKGVHPATSYIQYVGQDKELLRQFKRVHECRRYDLYLGSSDGS